MNSQGGDIETNANNKPIIINTRAKNCTKNNLELREIFLVAPFSSHWSDLCKSVIKIWTILVKTYASAGNRTRASRVAGENCPPQPPTLVTLEQY